MAKVRSPGALAAFIGRKKYGKARFQAMAGRGRSRAARGGAKTSAPGGGLRFQRMEASLAGRGRGRASASRSRGRSR